MQAASVLAGDLDHLALVQPQVGDLGTVADEGPAADLPAPLAATITHTAKRIYRLLELSGYARIDFRLTPDGAVYFLDANPNPEIAEREEFASAAKHAGIAYPELLERILRLGMHQSA